jgi:hypothetical protein
MDAVITRILETEKQSAMDIERAEEAYRKNIEVHRQTLEEEKKRAHTQIISTEDKRRTQAIQALNKQSEESSLASGRNYENRFQDPALVETVKERIVAILLM